MTTGLASEITSRAGDFLDRRFPGAHKDKRVAQALKISPDMAGLLRRGRGWTAERIAQVWKMFGQDFPLHVFALPVAPSELLAELAQLRAEVASTREEVANVSALVAALPLARLAGQEVGSASAPGERMGAVARTMGAGNRRLEVADAASRSRR